MCQQAVLFDSADVIVISAVLHESYSTANGSIPSAVWSYVGCFRLLINMVTPFNLPTHNNRLQLYHKIVLPLRNLFKFKEGEMAIFGQSSFNLNLF